VFQSFAEVLAPFFFVSAEGDVRVVHHEVLLSRTCTALSSAEEDVGGDGCYTRSRERGVSVGMGGSLDALEEFFRLFQNGEGDRRGER